jgi:hypothetical protein
VKSARRKEQVRDRATLGVVLSVLVIVVIVLGCPIVGAIIEGTIRWEQSFPH